MSRRGWMLVAALGASGIGLAGAQPGPAVEGKAATPVLQRSESDRIARMVRTAEREGFERHEIDRLLAIYAPGAKIIFGRRASPDAHDVAFDLEALRGTLEIRYSAPPARQEQIFFRDVEVEITGERAIMDATVTRELFSGREEMQQRYTLARRDGRWRVVEQRVWPLMRSQNGMPIVYNDETWLAAEERADALLADPDARPQVLLSALTEAGHMKVAYARTRAWTEAEPKNAAAWFARSRFALEVGDIADARAANARLAALGGQDGAVKTGGK